MDPDSDGDTKLRFADGAQSSYIKVASLQKATLAEWTAAKAAAKTDHTAVPVVTPKPVFAAEVRLFLPCYTLPQRRV